MKGRTIMEIEKYKNKPLNYLRDMLDINNDFISEWKKLSHDEKSELKKYATKEFNLVHQQYQAQTSKDK